MTSKFTALVITSLVLVAQSSFAEEVAPKSPWAHESEASVVKVDGNTTSDSYSAKQKTAYAFDMNKLIAAARYLQTRATGVETAKQWDASLRYERELTNQWSLFIQQQAESDYYAGYIQRDSTDLGGKYFFTKSDLENWFAEAGVRAQKTFAISGTTTNSSVGRLYSEYSKKFNDSVTGKFWFEYLPNFTDSEAYLLNYEPSVSVMMNHVFSLKVAYLVKFHNKIATATEKKEDTTLTTALVAKF